jgi:hypothetical protein
MKLKWLLGLLIFSIVSLISVGCGSDSGSSSSSSSSNSRGRGTDQNNLSLRSPMGNYDNISFQVYSEKDPIENVNTFNSIAKSSSTVPSQTTVQSNSFVWENVEGNGSFEQQIEEDTIVNIGEIPSGISNINISLNSTSDIDIQLYDKTTGEKIIAWPDGILHESFQQLTEYYGIKIIWSGYDGDGTGYGNEFIRIVGTTNRPLVMKAYGFQPGYAQVDYSWDTVDTSGSGSFEQLIEENLIVNVGEIPAGLNDVFIQLVSNKDVDIQLYDKTTGDAIIAWPEGILSGDKEQSTSYHDVLINWSGYNGGQTNDTLGNEYIRLSGKTNRPFVMKVFGYKSGTATVNYSWGSNDNSSNEGQGTFTQDIAGWDEDFENAITVGEISAGISNIFIGLKSSSDVDIRLYDEDGTKIIHWPDGLLSDFSYDSITYKGVTIEYSGYGGDDGSDLGHEYIKIKGTTPSKFIMKAFGFEAGNASVDYSWGKYSIFTGIRGGDPTEGDHWDGGDGITSYADASGIKSYLEEFENAWLCFLTPSSYKPNNQSDLEQIANCWGTGGIVAISYNIANTVFSRSTYNTSGNTDVLRADIETYYNLNPKAKIFLAGHSTGGGDVQNLLFKLKTLGIPVILSSHIDSVEIFSGDAKIANNTKNAIGFYQEDGYGIAGTITHGEDNLFAEDPSKTTVVNIKIENAEGPADPNNDSNAYHRNMDNDKRVWQKILDFIKDNN